MGLVKCSAGSMEYPMGSMKYPVGPMISPLGSTLCSAPRRLPPSSFPAPSLLHQRELTVIFPCCVFLGSLLFTEIGVKITD